ncbi:hypothetical protein [Bacillus cereus]|nr:hypothetical protein [Bacillus cereus]
MSDGRKYPNHPHPSLKSKQFAVDDDLVVVTEKQWGEIFGETL